MHPTIRDRLRHWENARVPREKLPLVREDEIRKVLAEAHSVVALSRDLPGLTITSATFSSQLSPETCAE